MLNDIELKKGKGRAVYIAVVLLLLIGIPFQIFPYFWMLTNSFKTDLEIIQVPPSFIPNEWSFAGIIQTFQVYNLWGNLANTLILCFGVILTQVPISAMAAYSISKLKPKYGHVVLLLFVGSMMISNQALMFPLFLMMSNVPILNINLINSVWAYILPSTSWGFTIFLFKGFFDALPDELLEASRIDGADSFRSFIRIALPLSKPVMAVNVLTTFMAVYNDYLYPTLVLPSEQNWPMMLRIFFSQGASRATWNNVMVMLTVSTIPVLLIYLLAQKQVVQGIAMTGLKG